MKRALFIGSTLVVFTTACFTLEEQIRISSCRQPLRVVQEHAPAAAPEPAAVPAASPALPDQQAQIEALQRQIRQLEADNAFRQRALEALERSRRLEAEQELWLPEAVSVYN